MKVYYRIEKRWVKIFTHLFFVFFTAFFLLSCGVDTREKILGLECFTPDKGQKFKAIDDFYYKEYVYISDSILGIENIPLHRVLKSETLTSFVALPVDREYEVIDRDFRERFNLAQKRSDSMGTHFFIENKAGKFYLFLMDGKKVDLLFINTSENAGALEKIFMDPGYYPERFSCN